MIIPCSREELRERLAAAEDRMQAILAGETATRRDANLPVEAAMLRELLRCRPTARRACVQAASADAGVSREAEDRRARIDAVVRRSREAGAFRR